MELVLERQDLLQLDPISNTGTLKLLPIGKKFKQKLIVGDDTGMVSCYEFKKGEPQVVFQTRVFEGPVSCIALGGNALKRDKIFASHTQKIVGLTKKGKDFFKLTSSLTEEIRNMVVEDTRIWTGCEYIYNLYDNGQDTAFFMSRDQINSLIVDQVTRDSVYDTVLGCQDSCVRIVQGSTLALEIPTSAPVNVVASLFGDEPRFRKGPAQILAGLETGSVGLLQIQPNGENSHLWSIDDARKGAVTCIKAFDITKDGIFEVIVGRADGRVEVFGNDPSGGAPKLICGKDIGESVRAIECGVVNTVDTNEVVVAAYSGKVLSFTSEPLSKRAQEDTYGRSVQTVNNENRIKALRKELEELKKKVDKEKEKAKKAAVSAAAAQAALVAAKASMDFNVISKFSLDVEHAAYVLTLELQSSIDIVILRSPVPLDLVDSEVGTAVVSVTPKAMLALCAGAGEESNNKFVAAFRCQGQVKRVSITLRTTEGEYGEMSVTVVAATDPKAAKVLKFPLKPLSLHTKLHDLSPEERERPRNRVKFTGTAAMMVMHEWCQAILPDVPPRLQDELTEERYYFKNSFTGAITLCEFRRNEICFESENASVIAIAKENVTRLANFRRVQLEETMTPVDATVSSFLTLVRPRLEHQLSLARKMDLLDSLQEITMQETDVSWLTPEYAEIIKDQETIRSEFKLRAKSLEYLSGIVTDLFVDWFRLQGVDARARIPELQQVILSPDFSFDGLVALFFSSKTGIGGRSRK